MGDARVVVGADPYRLVQESHNPVEATICHPPAFQAFPSGGRGTALRGG